MSFRPRFSLLIGCLLTALWGSCHAGTTIPFEYRDGLIWVKVSVGSDSPRLNFVLDSGAGASVLDLQVAQRLGVNLGASEAVRRVGTGATARRISDFQASVSGIPISGTPLALDLRDTSALCSRPIDGLLGFDFFQGRIVEINFKTQCIQLLDSADPGPSCTAVKLKITRDAMCVPLSVNGSRSKWTRLDTGCEDGLHWVGNSSGHARSSVQLGSESIEDVATALHKSPIFPSEAGLLGNGILSLYVVTIDTLKGRLLLQKS